MYFSAIDNGGTKVAYAVIDENGHIFEKGRWVRTGENTFDGSMRVFAEIIEKQKAKYPIVAVGLSTGGRFDVRTGHYNFGTSGSSGWIDRNIIGNLRERCHLPVAVENDCKAAIVGEHWKGEAREYETILGVIIGTGLGGGYMYHNEMIYGHRFGAGELGHSILYPNGKKCLCGQNGCGEMYCSGTALWSSYNERAGSGGISSGYEFFERYKNGDVIAAECLDKFACDLSLLLVSFANLYDPQIILIGGGIADTRAHWWDKMLKYYKQQSASFAGEIPIVASSLKNDAALLGAAKIALDMVQGRR